MWSYPHKQVKTPKVKIVKKAIVYKSESLYMRPNDSLSKQGELRRRHSDESAARGVYPGNVPFGYFKDADGAIAIDPIESSIVCRIFDLCVSDKCLLSISKSIRIEFGVHMSYRNIRLILEDCFYIGSFAWCDSWYSGVHPVFLSRSVFYRAQVILKKCICAKRDLGYYEKSRS